MLILILLNGQWGSYTALIVLIPFSCHFCFPESLCSEHTQLLISYVFLNSLRYNWHVTLCKLKAYKVLIWYIYILWNDHQITTVASANTSVITSHNYHFFIGMRTFKIYFLSKVLYFFHVCLSLLECKPCEGRDLCHLTHCLEQCLGQRRSSVPIVLMSEHYPAWRSPLERENHEESSCKGWGKKNIPACIFLKPVF